MTDKQIIKAFKCITYGEIDKCLRCPYDVYKECETFVYEDALDLIKRQQAEIEALKMDKEQLESDISNTLANLDHMTQLYEGAIKEFADKLKEKTFVIGFNASSEDYIDGYCAAINYYDAKIDNLVKEMVGADNEV